MTNPLIFNSMNNNNCPHNNGSSEEPPCVENNGNQPQGTNNRVHQQGTNNRVHQQGTDNQQYMPDDEHLNSMKNDAVESINHTNHVLNSNQCNSAKIQELRRTISVLSQYFNEIKHVIDTDPGQLKLHYIEDIYQELESNPEVSGILEQLSEDDEYIVDNNQSESENNQPENNPPEKDQPENDKHENDKPENDQPENNPSENDQPENDEQEPEDYTNNYDDEPYDYENHEDVDGELVPGIDQEKYTRRYIITAEEIQNRLNQLQNSKLSNQQANEYLNEMLQESGLATQ